jgi:hypothetical protein
MVCRQGLYVKGSAPKWGPAAAGPGGASEGVCAFTGLLAALPQEAV